MRRLALVLSLVLVLGFTSQAVAAYKISYMFVQHRVYEDGRDLSKLYFQIKDSAEQFVRDDLLQGIALYDPTGQIAILSGQFFMAHEYGYWAGYNCGMSQWNYDNVLHDESSYSFMIDSALLVGDYRLVVNYDDQVCELTYRFNGLVDLPIVESRTIKTKFDRKGNLFTSWEVPRDAYDLTNENPSLDTSARASIEIYDGDTYVGYLNTTVPTHMGEAFFPASAIELLKQYGDSLRFKVQLRTDDQQNNRSDSDSVELRIR